MCLPGSSCLCPDQLNGCTWCSLTHEILFGCFTVILCVHFPAWPSSFEMLWSGSLEYLGCMVRIFWLLLRSESPSGKCTKLRTVVASNNRVHMPWSLYYCLFVPHTCGVVLRAHPVRGESHNQRNTNGEVATTSPHFYNEPHRSHILFVKVSHSMTSTSWSQHHFVVIGKAQRQGAKLHTVAASNNSD